jgi:hypothetical protein
MSSGRQRVQHGSIPRTRGQINAVRAAFKAGVAPITDRSAIRLVTIGRAVGALLAVVVPPMHQSLQAIDILSVQVH